MVNYLKQSYATEYSITEAKTEKADFKQPTKMTAACCSEALHEKALRFGSLYDELRLKVIFIDHLQPSVLYYMRSYWRVRKEATLHSLKRHATLLVILRRGRGIAKLSTYEDAKSRRRSSSSPRVLTRITPFIIIEEGKN